MRGGDADDLLAAAGDRGHVFTWAAGDYTCDAKRLLPATFQKSADRSSFRVTIERNIGQCWNGLPTIGSRCGGACAYAVLCVKSAGE